MQIGAMNHPDRDPIDEIEMFASMGLEFIDFTMEPPCAPSWRIDPNEVRAALQDNGLGVVGHTAFYLPFASAFDVLRCAAVDELKRCLDLFAAIGANWMNIHPDPRAPFHERKFVVTKNIESMRELIEHGKSVGVGLMVENIPAGFNRAAQLAELLDPLPDLGLHLDIGHCNLDVLENSAGEILDRYGKRLAHVHMHDNDGGHADLHLPIGAGRIDFEKEIRILKATGYDSTITLEVFAPDKHFLMYSRDQLRRLWDAA